MPIDALSSHPPPAPPRRSPRRTDVFVLHKPPSNAAPSRLAPTPYPTFQTWRATRRVSFVLTFGVYDEPDGLTEQDLLSLSTLTLKRCSTLSAEICGGLGLEV